MTFGALGGFLRTPKNPPGYGPANNNTVQSAGIEYLLINRWILLVVTSGGRLLLLAQLEGGYLTQWLLFVYQEKQPVHPEQV